MFPKGFVNLVSKCKIQLLAGWLILCLNVQENKKAASSAEKDQESNPESGGASNENRHHSDLLCKSERSTWQTVPTRSQHSRAQTEGIVNHEC